LLGVVTQQYQRLFRYLRNRIFVEGLDGGSSQLFAANTPAQQHGHATLREVLVCWGGNLTNLLEYGGVQVAERGSDTIGNDRIGPQELRQRPEGRLEDAAARPTQAPNQQASRLGVSATTCGNQSRTLEHGVVGKLRNLRPG
jgi:hypothetical protein